MSSPPRYVLQGSFDVPADRWAAATAEVRAVLIQKAKQRAMVPYSELVGLVTSVNFGAHDQRLFAMLGQVSIEEDANGRPLLSVLVVHKNGDMKPGPGFFELATSLGRDTRDTDRAWIAETQKVYQYRNR